MNHHRSRYIAPEPLDRPLVGRRIRLLNTTDPITELKPGDQGVIHSIDRVTDIVHVRWDSGSTLSLLPGDDAFEVLS